MRSDTAQHALNAVMLQDSHKRKLEIIELAQIEQARLAEQNLHQQNEDAKTCIDSSGIACCS